MFFFIYLIFMVFIFFKCCQQRNRESYSLESSLKYKSWSFKMLYHFFHWSSAVPYQGMHIRIFIFEHLEQSGYFHFRGHHSPLNYFNSAACFTKIQLYNGISWSIKLQNLYNHQKYSGIRGSMAHEESINAVLHFGKPNSNNCGYFMVHRNV